MRTTSHTKAESGLELRQKNTLITDAVRPRPRIQQSVPSHPDETSGVNQMPRELSILAEIVPETPISTYPGGIPYNACTEMDVSVLCDARSDSTM